MTLPADFDIQEFIRRILAEDLGTGGDVTSKVTIAPDARFTAEMNSRQPIIVAGVDIAEAVFRALDPEVEVERAAADGDAVGARAVLMRLRGKAQAMLTAERSALNTVQHLSGIATLTRQYVDAIAGTGTVVLDTRKTLPGLRVLEKYASRMGGAQNHRMRLDDGILIKDNHVALCGGAAEAVRRAKAAQTGLQVQVEVDRIDQIEPALAAGADRLLLDNMDPAMLRQAVALVGGRVPIEASASSRRPASISFRSAASPSRHPRSISASIIRSTDKFARALSGAGAAD
jgi:nicotinate-nucleotide pyrophosphorylase (carboxylating)